MIRDPRQLLWWNRSTHAAARSLPPPPKFIAFQYGGCMPPWTFAPMARGDVLLLRETVAPTREELSRNTIGPFAVTRPRWLVGASAPPARLSLRWSARKLLFFAGHVPKLYLSHTRFLLWYHLRRDARVTAISKTLNCTVGAFSVCGLGSALLGQANASLLQDFCRPWCGAAAGTCGSSKRDPLALARRRMVNHCKACAPSRPRRHRRPRAAAWAQDAPSLAAPTDVRAPARSQTLAWTGAKFCPTLCATRARCRTRTSWPGRCGTASASSRRETSATRRPRLRRP